MSTELWIAILTFGTSAVGAIRWLIHVYWKQAEQIEDLRSQNEKRHLLGIKDAVDELRKELREQKRVMSELSSRMFKAQAAIEKNTSDSKDLLLMVSKYIEISTVRFKKMESEIIEIGKGLILIKGSGNGQKN